MIWSLFPKLNLFITAVALAVAASGWLVYLFTKRELEKTQEAFILAKKNLEECRADLTGTIRDFEEDLKKVMANCKREKEILRKDLERQLKACRAELEREKKLKDVLEEIEEL